MFRVVLFSAFLALSQSHAVLPVVVPAAHSIHVPLVAPYPVHSYGYGLGLGHGFLAKPLGHHILKRSPHLVAPLAHHHLGHVAPFAHVAPIAAVAPVAAIAPVAVSHQSRVDLRTSPAVIAPVLPVVKPVVAPFVHATPLLHKPILTPYHGVEHYGAGNGHLGLGHY